MENLHTIDRIKIYLLFLNNFEKAFFLKTEKKKQQQFFAPLNPIVKMSPKLASTVATIPYLYNVS